jgi:hypothetical protein
MLRPTEFLTATLAFDGGSSTTWRFGWHGISNGATGFEERRKNQ